MSYIFYYELQRFMTNYYEKTGKTLSFSNALGRMLSQNIVHDGPVPTIDFSTCNLLDKTEINYYIDQVAIPYSDRTIKLESNRSLQDSLIVFKYPIHSRAGIHIQNGFELNYVYSGSCTMYFEGKTYTINENEVVILPPDTHHDIYNTENSIVFSFLVHQDYFNETFFQVLQTDTPLSTFYDLCLYHYAKVFLHFQITEPQKFLSTFLSMYSEFASNRPYSHDICINYIRILFAHLLRQPKWDFEHKFLDASQNMLNSMPVILHYIKCNYQSVSLNFLADFFHYDRSHLGKLIKKYTNFSFSELVTGYRLDHAVSLLLNTTKSMGDIAQETGYQSTDHFSRMFKQKYKIAPSKYRKQYQN